ncbi:MAG: hypothetical protein ACHQFW_03125 [Chitinophagales bacterium]
MKKILIIVLTSISSFSVYSQTELQGHIKSQAEIMVNAFMHEQYDLLLDYTYPKIFAVTGGREVMRSLIEEMMTDLKTQGITVDSAKVGEAGPIYTAGSELHAIINQYVYMKIPDGKMISESSLLAISMDKGSKWYYIDIAQLTPELKKEFFPEFNNDLVVPEPKQPVIIYDSE